MRFALDQHLYASHGQNKLKTETVSEPEARLDIYDKSKKQNAKQKQIHVAASNAAYNDLCALLRVPLSTFRCRRRHRRHCGCRCRQCCSNRSSLRMLNKTICMRLSVPITNLAYCLSLFIWNFNVCYTLAESILVLAMNLQRTLAETISYSCHIATEMTTLNFFLHILNIPIGTIGRNTCFCMKTS